MCRIECLCDRIDDGCRTVWLDPLVLAQHRAEIGSVDEPHRDVKEAFLLARSIDRDHVRVIDLGRDLPLTLKPAAKRGLVGEVRSDDLHCVGTLQLQVGRPVNDPYPDRPTTASIR
jgi:hypothetical protein